MKNIKHLMYVLLGLSIIVIIGYFVFVGFMV